jgi:hypothetical protein
VQDYLGAAPVLLQAEAGWTRAPDHDAINLDNARNMNEFNYINEFVVDGEQRFHLDDNSEIGPFVKVFVYLHDTDRNLGAHRVVPASSHKLAKLYGQIDDDARIWFASKTRLSIRALSDAFCPETELVHSQKITPASKNPILGCEKWVEGVIGTVFIEDTTINYHAGTGINVNEKERPGTRLIVQLVFGAAAKKFPHTKSEFRVPPSRREAIQAARRYYPRLLSTLNIADFSSE